ncbi:hypothetical protein HN51_063881 [Arachis hypogaea]
MKEWKILEEHLPDSIYVRVYESRIDLMRAVIVGAAGTPLPRWSLLLRHQVLLEISKQPSDLILPLLWARSQPEPLQLGQGLLEPSQHVVRRKVRPTRLDTVPAHVATRESPSSQAAQELRDLHQESFLHPGCHRLGRVPREDLYPKLVQMFQSLGSFHVPEKLELEEDEQVNNGDENKSSGKIIVVASPKDKKKVGIFKKVVARIKGVVISGRIRIVVETTK